jgi:gliding motility-associated-like protein
LENDWINSATFISDSSHVYLDGDNELITGDSISRYFYLTLEGTGVKTQTIDAEVQKQLNLNDLELATQDNVMYVSNSWEDAIIHQATYLNEGLVSSTTGGLLIRQVDSTFNYLYPVGSKVNGHQYRPVMFENLSLASEQIGVRMIPEDATANGLDRDLRDTMICFINDGYYHQISGVSNPNQSNIGIFFDPQTEPIWNVLTQWNTPTNNLWNTLSSTTASLTNYAGRTVSNHNDYSNEFYGLGYYNEVAPVIYGDTIICDTSLVVEYSTDNFASYSWEAENNGNSIAFSNQETIDVQWINGTGNTLSLVATDAYGCISPVTSVNVGVDHILAAYDTLPGGGAGTIIFNNTSLGADNYEWTIGNYTSSNEHEEYTFNQIGDYEIELIVTNDLGCSDTISEILSIPALFWVPNVFTPNGEYGNDLFFIDALGVEEYRLQIFDRWGLLMFESTNSAWDGTNQQNNQPVPEGTYYFIYNATDHSGEKYQFTGPLTLIR